VLDESRDVHEFLHYERVLRHSTGP
jgi:hypothetical protein